MENASKALIIAGAILLSILIIALGIYVFNMAKNATNTDQLTELEIQQFNAKYTDYEGERLGSMVANLLENVMANCSDNAEADERLMDIVYVDSRGKITADSLGVGNNDEGKAEGKATDEDTAAKTAALNQSGDSDGIHIWSNSSNTNHLAMGKLRAQLASRHYYKITPHVNSKSGFVDCIVISYDT